MHRSEGQLVRQQVEAAAGKTPDASTDPDIDLLIILTSPVAF